MAWLCQCGNGSLVGAPPDECPLCGFPLAEYFGGIDDEDDEDAQAAAHAVNTLPLALGEIEPLRAAAA